MTNRTGQCLCGAVRVKATDVADTFSTCYCKACQRWAGGPFSGVSVATENLEVDGPEHVGVIQSSSFAERAFCKKCGSAVWWRLTSGQYVGNTSIPVGLLDDRSGLVLTSEYFIDYKDSSNDVPEGVEQLTAADVEAIIATFDEEPAP